jgi:hypothetical protein
MLNLSSGRWFLVLVVATAALFARPADAQFRIGILGDSISANYPTTGRGGPPNYDRSWVQIQQDINGSAIQFNNQSVDGMETPDPISGGQVNNLRNAVGAGQLDGVGIELGVDDIASGHLVDVFTGAMSTQSIANEIITNLTTICNTIESGPRQVPMFVATIPDFLQTTYFRDMMSLIPAYTPGEPMNPLLQQLLAEAPAQFRNLVENGVSQAQVNAGVANLSAAILAANHDIELLDAQRNYGYVDLYGVLHIYGSGDVVLGSTPVPQDLLYSEYDDWHSSSILSAMASNVAIEATVKEGFNTQGLILSDQQILSYWDSHASVQLPVTGNDTYVIDSEMLNYLTTDPLAVPEPPIGVIVAALAVCMLPLVRARRMAA